MSTEDNHKRQRVSRACDNCRRKKIRCGGEQPVCSNCQSFGMECTYNDTKKKRGPPKGYIEAIESRLHRMEHILGGLVQSDPRAAETVMLEMRRLEEEANTAIKAQPKVKPLEFREYRVPNAQIPDSPLEANSPTATAPNATTANESKKSVSPHNPNTLNALSSTEPARPSTMSPSIALTTDADIETLSNTTDQLILDDEGRVRHCGKSSGLYLLQGSQKYQNDLFKIRPRVTATINRVDINPDPTALPSPNLFAYLVDVYFSKINPVFPLLHKEEFMERLNRSEQEMPYFLVNAMFSLSAALISSENILNKENLDAEGFFKKARTLLDQAYDVSSIENVQGLVLMSIYFHISQGGMKSWMYSGMAIRMAEDLGLHRDPDIWNIKLTTAEKETRKRTWWVCYLIDRFSSVCVGRPVSIDDQQFDTPLPSLTDDDLLTPNGVSPRTGLSLRPFHEVIKLHELIGRILSTMYIVRAPLTSNYQKFRTSLIDLDSQLNVWLNSLPADLAYVPTNYCTGNPPRSPTLIYAHVCLFKNLETLRQIRERCGYAGRYYTILSDLITESNVTPEQETSAGSPIIDLQNANPNDMSMGQPLAEIQQNQFLLDLAPKSEALTRTSLSPASLTMDFPAIPPYVEGAFKVIEERASPNFDVIATLDPYAIPGAFEQARTSAISGNSTLNPALYDPNTTGLGASFDDTTSRDDGMGWNSQLAFNFDEWNDYVGQCVAGVIVNPSDRGPITSSTAEATNNFSSATDGYTISSTYPTTNRPTIESDPQRSSSENTGPMNTLPTTEYVSGAELAMAYDLISHQSSQSKYPW
ncbi:hypothetical protein K493DRAFT_403602 [Basidiobolus meristosporus CBS 931.73]|uniref:Zn(2)-C6 fungal-type domain-containing protein n=1 Tax=Basidiobolus meristosporus CBS 931.73 TaxID=1314790 RepID=A0A1Y1ZC78_9FUNG|nr:hypothetical protein K493DRAFT_403602 [Basidiobolus meristosporus CBS 931.73]|eukprot:ORY07858.1 hypothetical protein K493DRAFT_403602 [Basidiobolus meristosporus CBS 931.73]